MAASDHSKVSPYRLDLKKNLGSHFRNLKTLEKSKSYLDNFSSHLEKTMCEGKYHLWLTGLTNTGFIRSRTQTNQKKKKKQMGYGEDKEWKSYFWNHNLFSKINNNHTYRYLRRNADTSWYGNFHLTQILPSFGFQIIYINIIHFLSCTNRLHLL